MGYKRAEWHSGLTYHQDCYECNTPIDYTDHKLGFRPWFADGFVYCPKCRTPLRHREEYAINQQPVVTNTPAAQAPVWEQPAAPVAQAPVWEQPAAPVAQAPVWEQPAAPVAQAPVWEEPAVQAPIWEEKAEEPVIFPTSVEPVYEQPVQAAPEILAAPVEQVPVEVAPIVFEEEETPRFCSKCGKPFRDDDIFCSRCGAKRI